MKESKLHKAIIEVTKEVKSIDKDMTIGKGQNAYKGVADKDVKQKIGQSMAKHGLTCLMVKIEPTVTIERWEDPQYKNMKQSVFTEVLATFRITHAETDEHVEIMGYGHGVDPQDKSAGKATTYALKNALLYTFLVPTGEIDDTDTTHSNEQQVPAMQNPPKPPTKPKATPKEVGRYTEDPSIESMTKWVKDRQKTMGGVLIDANFCNDNYTLTDAQYNNMVKLDNYLELKGY